MKKISAIATLSLVGLVGVPALPAYSQSRSERVNQIADALSGAVQTRTAPAAASPRTSPEQLMRETMTQVDFEEMPAKLALDIWQNQTQVPLVINWKALELVGVDQSTPITLKLSKVPADVVLKLIVGQMQAADGIEEDRLLIDTERWFVRVMTKSEALRRSKTKVYFIGDLLMDIPSFEGPGFDLNDALSNTSSGGSNGGGGNGGGGGLFGPAEDQPAEQVLSKQERAELIMDLIRDSIEPDIWQANGGEYASIRYMRNMIVVKAPEFVHRQIGVPSQGNRPAARTSASPHRSGDGKQSKPVDGTGGNVAGKAPKGPKLVR